MANIVVQPSFFSGQVDPIQFTRTSFQNYLSAAQSLKNCVVDTTGIVHKRDGTVINKVLKEKFDLVIGFNANDGKWYTALFRDYALQIYGDGFEQRLVTKIKDPLRVDYTYMGDSIVIFYGGTVETGALPPMRLHIDKNAFVLEDLEFSPLPARDFGDVDYINAKVNIYSSTLTIDTLGFDDSWVGGTILGVGKSQDDLIGDAEITSVVVTDKTTSFGIDIRKDFGSIKTGVDLSIRKPMIGPKIGWPTKGISYANRLWLMGMPKSQDWLVGSAVNKPTSFRFFTRAVDAIAAQVPTTDRKEAIIWLHAGSRLEVYTDNAVYTTAASDGIVMPNNFQLVRRTTFGASAKFKPISYQNESYYISRTGNSLIKFEHDVLTNTGKATNVTKAAQTLIKDPVDRTLIVGTSSTQDNYIYGLNKDKQLFNFQFSSEIGLAAVTPLEMEGDIISIAEVNNNLTLLKRLPNSDTYTLETLSRSALGARIYLDSISHHTANKDLEIHGLDAYNGYKVRVTYIDKYHTLQDLGEYAVYNSKIKLENYYDDVFDFFIGFTYNVDITPMYFYLGPNHSTTMKKVSDIIVEYYDSLDFYVDNSLIKYQTYKEINDHTGLLNKTGSVVQPFLHGHHRYHTFKITQKSPFNLCITSIAYKVTGAYV